MFCEIFYIRSKTAECVDQWSDWTLPKSIRAVNHSVKTERGCGESEKEAEGCRSGAEIIDLSRTTSGIELLEGCDKFARVVAVRQIAQFPAAERPTTDQCSRSDAF